jgi:glycosyltransferase involved in cell wall biosynthesis
VEIIVVDDASVDETSAVCRKLTGIRYIRLERNQGVADARNVGLLASRSDYVAFLDDDDLRLPGSIDLQSDALDANPDVGFVCGAMLLANQDYSVTGESPAQPAGKGDRFWELLELDFPVVPLCVLIRKASFARVGLLNGRLRGIDDWDIFVRIAELYPAMVLENVVGIYRCPGPSSGQGSSSQASQLYQALAHQRQLFRLPRVRLATSLQRKRVRRRTVNRVADTLLWNAVGLLRARAFDSAAANIFTALRLNPLRALRPRSLMKLDQIFVGTRRESLIKR